MSRALLLFFVLLLSLHVYSQEPSWSSCKSFLECQTYVHSWQVWADENLPKCKAAMADAKKLDVASAELRYENDNLRSKNKGLEHRRIEFNLLTAAIGIGIGIGAAFYLARSLRRFWRPVTFHSLTEGRESRRRSPRLLTPCDGRRNC